MIEGTFRQTNLANESPEYLSKREELRLAEIESMKLRERVAELRRQLPKGATVEDYSFVEGPEYLDAGDSRDADGTLRHTYSAHPRMGAEIKERGIDLLTPVYNLLDLTPKGRGDWYASLDYGT
ncbi:MAG: DUF899 family protein [Sulfuricella sp.]|nr:DUF899 family protein [Sulfuricella sp.]